MEAVYIELSAVSVGAAFAGLLALVAVIGGIFLAWTAEAEAAGARITWADWPFPEMVAPAEKARVRLAA